MRQLNQLVKTKVKLLTVTKEINQTVKYPKN